MELSTANQEILLELARRSIRSALSGQFSLAMPETPEPELMLQAGCFVTLHDKNSHRLRGCIGAIQTAEPLVKTVQQMAAASLEDPRFTNYRITLDQLSSLEIDISVLSPLEPVQDPLDWEPGIHGTFLVFGKKTGVFLPQVAKETGWTREQLLDRLCSEKMGLSPLIWRNPHTRLLRFTSLVIGPVPFIPAPMTSPAERA